MKKLYVVIFTIAAMLIFPITGCSQGSNKKEVTPPPVNSKNNLPNIDNALKKEAESNYSFQEPFVALNPYENAPLSAVVIFTTDIETAVKIEVMGHEEAYSIEIQSPKTKKHILPIYGLYAGEENKVLLTLDDGTAKELIITTESIDASYKKVEVIKAESSKMKKGLTFVSLGQRLSNGIVAAAYDNSGEMRWALILPGIFTNSKMADFCFPHRKNILNPITPPVYGK